MRLAILMRTADRGPARDYLSQSLVQLRRQGVAREQIHLFPTSPDLAWLPPLVPDQCVCHVPSRPYLATENMGACLSQAPDADWVIHLEDDVRLCDDFLGSVTRWLRAHAEAYRIASFFTVQSPTTIALALRNQLSAVPVPVAKMNSAVAIALRPDDARACGAWITAAAPTWRTGPTFPAWAHRRGADKMIGAWHQRAHPTQSHLIAAIPDFVQHEGATSTLRGLGTFRYVRSSRFSGRAWGAA